MKTISKILIILPGFLIHLGLFAQPEKMNYFYQEYLSVKHQTNSYPDKVVGSPYKTEEFRDAKIFMKGSKDPIYGSMRYNNYNDEMEFQIEKDGQILTLDRKNTLDSILLDNKTYRYLQFTKENVADFGFFVCLTYKECKLYSRNLKKFQGEKLPKSGYEDYVPPSFIDVGEEFFVDFGDGMLVYLPERGKKIQELFLEKGFENTEMQKLKYNEEDLREYVGGLKRVGL